MDAIGELNFEQLIFHLFLAGMLLEMYRILDICHIYILSFLLHKSKIERDGKEL